MPEPIPPQVASLASQIGGKEALRQIANLDPRLRDFGRRYSAGVTSDMAAIWSPFSGPQTLAYGSLADELFFGGSAGGGKALSLDTPVPTPTGWTTMGDIRSGDVVFDASGAPCRVLAASPVMHGRPCYELVFDDGERIVADADHRWATFTDAERTAILRRSPEARARRRSIRPPRGTGKKPWLSERNRERAATHTPAPVTGAVRTTREIAATLRRGQRTNHSIALSGAVLCPSVELPVPPYTLGVWLGDGNSRHGRIYIADPDLATVARVAADGYSPRRVPSERIGWCVPGLQAALRVLALLANKHIPPLYLRASVEQRIQLLRGLMDTDGCSDADGGAEYTSTIARLANDVLELARGLGLKATLTIGRATLRGRDCGSKYRVKMTTDQPVFHLARKAARQPSALRRTQRQRYIVECQPVPSVPVRCIEVDSPSHLFLAGAGFVPTHNSDLLLGLAATKHIRSVIFRREFAQLSDLLLRSREVLGAVGSFNGSRYLWHGLPGMRTIEFGGLAQEDDKQKWKGRPHDFYGFDELSDITESQFRFVKAWNRTSIVGQRCRVIGAGNPPSSSEGEWVIRYWAPWLDSQHPNPAMPGELRWFVMIPDEGDIEVADATPVSHIRPSGEQEWITPKSRTFIPARVTDNPVYMQTGYIITLQALPEPLRSQLLYGDFTIGATDDPWQIIPTMWARLAQIRWREGGGKPPLGAGLDALGVDVARSGADQTCIARRYGNWFAPVEAHPGRETRDGPAVVRLVLLAYDDPAAAINIDVLGIGASPHDLLKLLPNLAGNVHGIAFNEGSIAHDRTGRLKFANKRAEAYWRFRELLDPELGAGIALPPDPELLADLTSARWSVGLRGIIVEPKDEIQTRIGRSPDKGDAVVLAAWTHYHTAHFHGIDAEVLNSLNDARPAERMAAQERLTQQEEWLAAEQEEHNRLAAMDDATRNHVLSILNGWNGGPM